MSVSFLRRLGAYLFDIFVVTLLISVITLKFNSNSNIMNKMEDLLTEVNNKEITIDEYSNQIFELNYEYQKGLVPSTIVNIAINIGYFIIFACLNKGQTLGKKVFKIKIVNTEGKKPSVWNMLVRSLFLYGIFASIVNVVGIYVFNVKVFNYASSIVNYLYYGFVIISLFMVMYKKDKRGLHDIIGRTSVVGVEEVK